jgi:hypothetical protein
MSDGHRFARTGQLATLPVMMRGHDEMPALPLPQPERRQILPKMRVPIQPAMSLLWKHPFSRKPFL